jgi:hypothetical protein
MIVENIVRWQNFLRRAAFLGEEVPWYKEETLTHSLADELLIRQQVQEAFTEYNDDALTLKSLKQRKNSREWRRAGRLTRHETRNATARARRAANSPTKPANRGKGSKLSPGERETLRQRKFDIGETNEETGSIHYSVSSEVPTSPGENSPGGSLPPATVEPPEPLPTGSTGQDVVPILLSDVSETDSIDGTNATRDSDKDSCYEYEYEDVDDDGENEDDEDDTDPEFDDEDDTDQVLEDEDDTDQVMDNLDNDRDRTIALRGDAPGTPLQDEHESP